MDMPRCATCLFYFDQKDPGAMSDTDEPWGYCRAHPPTFDHTQVDVDTHVYDFDVMCWHNPSVLASHWCGEHQPTIPAPSEGKT